MIYDPFTKWNARLGSQTWAFARRLAKGIHVQELLQSHGGGAALPEDSNQLHGWLENPCTGLELGKGSIKGEVSITMRDCRRVSLKLLEQDPIWMKLLGLIFEPGAVASNVLFAGPWRQGRLLNLIIVHNPLFSKHVHSYGRVCFPVPAPTGA
jgi:hypothetical protein